MTSLLAFRHSAQTRLFWHSEISPRLDLYLIPREGALVRYASAGGS